MDEDRRYSTHVSFSRLREYAHDVLRIREANLGVREHDVHGSHTHTLEQVGQSSSNDGTDRRVQG